MKLIIAGSRHLNLGTMIMDVAISSIPELSRMVPNTHNFDKKFKITEVVSGGAKGIDQMGEKWASSVFWEVRGPQMPKVTRFEADWAKYGIRAGPIRNNKMAVYADALLLIWDGKSAGSKHMKSAMIKLGKPVYEVIFGVK